MQVKTDTEHGHTTFHFTLSDNESLGARFLVKGLPRARGFCLFASHVISQSDLPFIREEERIFFI